MKRLLYLLLALPGLVCAQDPGLIINGEATATLTWTPPTEYEDGRALPPSDIAGYVIYWSEQSRFEADGVTLRPTCSEYPVGTRTDATCYQNVLDLTDGTATTELIILTLDQDVTLHFAAAAHVTNGDWSAYSNEASKSFTLVLESPPAAPVIQSIDMTIMCTTNLPNVTCSFDVQ